MFSQHNKNENIILNRLSVISIQMLLSYKYDTGQTWGHAKTQNMQEQKRFTETFNSFLQRIKLKRRDKLPQEMDLLGIWNTTKNKNKEKEQATTGEGFIRNLDNYKE